MFYPLNLEKHKNCGSPDPAVGTGARGGVVHRQAVSVWQTNHRLDGDLTIKDGDFSNKNIETTRI